MHTRKRIYPACAAFDAMLKNGLSREETADCLNGYYTRRAAPVGEKIRKAMKEFIPGTTKFIIAQRISSVDSADRVIVMHEGTVSGFDTPENLLKTNDIYREVYETQTAGGGDFDMKGGAH